MKITIHRGTDQIGGCITEYEIDGWKLFVDYGEQLPGTTKTDASLKIQGLNCGDLSKSLVLITHYHGDHIGRLSEIAKIIPVLVTHTPPFGILDFDDSINYGSEELLRIVSAINPRLHLFGHIHRQHGIIKRAQTIFSNGAILSANYSIHNTPNVLTLPLSKI